MTLDEAREAGLDAFELVADFAKSSRGLRRPGQVRPRHDRGGPGDARAGRARRWPARCLGGDPRVRRWRSRPTSPIDVLAETIHAFPSTSRILNGLFADARRELDEGTSPRQDGTPTRAPAERQPTRAASLASGFEHDPAVHHHDAGRAVASAPPGSTGSRSAAAGMTTTSARWPTVSRPRSVPAAETAGSTHAARSARSSDSASCGPYGGVPPASAASSRRTASAMPGHGSNGSTGASVPNAHDGARRRDRRPRVAVRLGPIAPQLPCLGGIGAEVDRLDAGRDRRPRRSCRDRPDRAAGRARAAASAGTRGGRRSEHLERGPDRRVPDGVDLRRDPGVCGAFGQLVEHARVR